MQVKFIRLFLIVVVFVGLVHAATVKIQHRTPQQSPRKFSKSDDKTDLTCGSRPMFDRTGHRVARIVGGSSATEGQWPWHVIVKVNTFFGVLTSYKCGGVLISERHVLTAAHCEPSWLLSTLDVTLGRSKISENNLQIIRVKKMIVHERFNPENYHNDLALLELDAPAQLGPKIVPICLPDADEDFVELTGHVSGWGRVAFGGGLPKTLQSVEVPIISGRACQQIFKEQGFERSLGDMFICAGYEEGEQDACDGDSGGPLSVQKTDGIWVLAGTVSHGIRCAEPNRPGVYMNIPFYRSWIERMMAHEEAADETRVGWIFRLFTLNVIKRP